jgi:hypothetical protein
MAEEGMSTLKFTKHARIAASNAHASGVIVWKNPRIHRDASKNRPFTVPAHKISN